MTTDMEFQTVEVRLPHDRNVHVVCESEEHAFFGQTKQTFNFDLPPNASVDVVRELVADKLSVAPASVHLQLLVRESNEYETVTCGNIAEAIFASNPESNTLSVVYSTESRYGCFYLCCAALCAACCAAGYAAGSSAEKKNQRRRPPPRPRPSQNKPSQPYGNQADTQVQYPQATPANQYYQNSNAQPPQTYAYGSPVQYTAPPQQGTYQAAPPNGYGSPPPPPQNPGGKQAPVPL
ncbi:hypothetical protein ABB37_04197 [Leptomonas pyrrhocoris]|uniref:Ubiquitin-like domain-containing protein n=1 Tax=Leptomonas pyrrhocoris TaxID=157538 RepID=A0A0M9G210_LEPPY|nr:hypothetical protein ABB37_04197 [Leptomonas pyrrhocoris]KPA80735.1 hypothetical protein ABB37_04197 [Leptomonas pyrrhocoris]|eukprot:XP_015659174.1 hypothetical protein ABB37_04197 [Leptomonas pyrrhocoris]